MQDMNGLQSAPAWLAIVGFVLLLGAAVAIGVGAAYGLLYLIMLTRGMRRCDECGRRFCVVEVKRDLTLEHKGVFDR